MKINERISQIEKPIARVILMTLGYISLLVILIPSIPYAMIKGAGNNDYYDDWFNFIKKYIPL